jgi:hypothetical protein
MNRSISAHRQQTQNISMLCDVLERARPALLILPQAMCGGIGLRRGFGRWNCGASACGGSSATLAAER